MNDGVIAMKVPFTKMQGCGNDYIYFDGFEKRIPNPGETCIALSDRHFGIGGDGIIIIAPSEIADGRMIMFNVDGSEGSMCGNGIRCVGRYLYERRGMHKKTLTVETKSGIKTLRMDVVNGKVDLVHVDMGKAEFTPQLVPVNLDGVAVINRPVDIGGETVNITCVSMGNPHCVLFGGDPDRLDLPAIGPVFEHHPLFPDRVNTEFIQVVNDHTLKCAYGNGAAAKRWPAEQVLVRRWRRRLKTVIARWIPRSLYGCAAVRW